LDDDSTIQRLLQTKRSTLVCRNLRTHGFHRNLHGVIFLLVLARRFFPLRAFGFQRSHRVHGELFGVRVVALGDGEFFDDNRSFLFRRFRLLCQLHQRFIRFLLLSRVSVQRCVRRSRGGLCRLELRKKLGSRFSRSFFQTGEGNG